MGKGTDTAKERREDETRFLHGGLSDQHEAPEKGPSSGEWDSIGRPAMITGNRPPKKSGKTIKTPELSVV